MSESTRPTDPGDLRQLLLRAGRPSAPREARRRAAVAAAGALAASTVAAKTAVAAGGAKGALATLKWLGVAGVLGVGAMAAAVTVKEHFDEPAVRGVASAPPEVSAVVARPWAPPGSSAAVVPSPSTVVSPEPSVAAAVASSTAPGIVPAAPLNAAPSTAPSSSAATSVATELAALEQARAVLDSGNPARALALLDDYAVRFPRGAMAPEAAVLRIDALLRAGDPSAARRAADAFLASDSRSPYAARVRTLVGIPAP